MSTLPPVASAFFLAQDAPAQIAAHSLRERLLSPFAIPDIAALALVIGVLLIYLEFNVPGKVLPGALGTLSIALGFFGLSQSPIRYTSALLLLGGIALLVLEARFRFYGVLALTGAISFIFGLSTLVKNSSTGQHVHRSTAIVLGAIFSTATLTLSSIAIRARRNKAIPGPWL